MTPLICALAVAASIRPQLDALAKVAGEPSVVSAAGMSKAEDPILTIENGAAFDPADRRRRLVIVGSGDDARVADAVIAAVKWMKTAAPADLRREWIVSAMPLSGSDPADAQALKRWVTFQTPDLLVGVGADGPPAPAAIDGVALAPLGAANLVEMLPRVMRAERTRWSPLHDTLSARVRRPPLEVAQLLARRYPEAPAISYISAVSWVNALKLGAISGDSTLRQRVTGQLEPWTSGEKKMFGDRIQLTAVAGAMVFAELAMSDGGDAEVALAREASSLAAAKRPDGIAQYGQGWTDDMFMASSVLSRTGRVDAAADLLTSYAARLQRADGLFNHAVDGPAAWGRGNGFAALGLVEALSAMPDGHPARARLLEIYRRQMSALKAQQAPDGAWREVIDDAAAYREETATAMLLTAMARGIRLGWIDRSYTSNVDRAWRALSAHVVDDGTVIDVCTGTGVGPTHRYYFDRPAITGADDRGGAMALLAAMEMYELSRK